LFLFVLSAIRSDRTAAAIAPDESHRAAATGNDHDRPLDHDGAGCDHHGRTTVGPALAVGITVEAGAAAAFGACAADTCNRACNQ
jgi:hypothetical protein